MTHKKQIRLWIMRKQTNFTTVFNRILRHSSFYGLPQGRYVWISAGRVQWTGRRIAGESGTSFWGRSDKAHQLLLGGNRPSDATRWNCLDESPSLSLLQSINQSINRLINQFIYWDNTSHDNYNPTVTRRAASKAVTSFFSQRKCLMHYPVQDGGQAHECVDTIPINGVALCLARLVLGKVTVKPARVWPSLRGQDRHNKYKRNAEIKNARDFFLFLQKTFNALSTI